MLGRAGQRFLLFGMLTHSPDGRLCLEDLDGRVPLDISETVRFLTEINAFQRRISSYLSQGPSEGLFTEGCFVLVEGEYTDDEVLVVIALGHPPSEKREVAR
jgi:DNA polymerase epsilon subunit 2